MEYSQIPAKSLSNEPPDPISRRAYTRAMSRRRSLLIFAALLLVPSVAAMAEITPTPTTDVRLLQLPDRIDDLGELGRSDGDIIRDDNYVSLGSGSSLLIDNNTLLQVGAIGGNPNVTDPGTFSIDVVQGGLLQVISINTAVAADSDSNMLVDGVGSVVRAQDDVFIGVGPGGSGDLRLLNDGFMEITQTSNELSQDNNYFVSGSGLLVGAASATGSLEIDSAMLRITRDSTAFGNDSLTLGVGLDGTGTATIQNGAFVSIEDFFGIDGTDGLVIGHAGASTWAKGRADGSMVITDAGTVVSITSALGSVRIGTSYFDGLGSAIGTLDVLNGATLELSGAGSGLSIGRGGGADGSMTVSGAGSRADIVGTAAAVVLMGSDAVADNEPALNAGNALASLTVSDQGVVNVVADDARGSALFYVGHGAGDAQVLVDSGGEIGIDGSLFVSLANVNDTQTGLVTINDTGVVNTLTTIVGQRGTVTGTGTLNTNLLTVGQGGLVNLTHLSGVVLTEVDSGTIDVPNDLTLGLPDGQAINVRSDSLFRVDGNLAIGSSNGAATVLLEEPGESSLDTTTTTVGNLGQLLGAGPIRTDLLIVETGGLAQVSDVRDVAAFDVSGGQLDVPVDLILGRSLAQSMAVNDGGVANITGTLFLGGESTGTLGGDGGSVFADAIVVNFDGVLGPGNSVGTLDIFGDLTLGGGELLFEIAGTDAGQYDILNVDGNVALDSGTLRFLPIDGFSPTGVDTNLEVLFATGTLGLDPGVQILGDGLGPDFMFTVGSGANGNVGTVEFLAMDIGPVVDDPPPVADGDDIAGVTGPNLNRQRMAKYLDDLCPRIESLSSPSSDEADLDQRCGNLRNVGTTSSQVMTALDAISPDDIINNVSSVLRFAPTQHGTLTRRLNGLRSGSSRINVTGLNIETEDVRLEGEDLQKALEALTDGEFGRWGFFTDGRMNFGSHEATDRVPGFDFDTISATVGTDYRLRPNAYLGAALSYNEADADFDAGGGTTLKTTTLSAFATYFRESAFYADVMVSYGMGDLDTARDVMYEDAGGILFRQARGTTDGEQLSAGAGTGFDFSANQWVFGPHLGLYYSDYTLDAFEETGAGGLNFAFPEQNPKSFIANGGVHVSRSFTPGWGVFVPYARVDFVHEFDNSVAQTGARLVNDRFAFDPNPTLAPVIEDDGADPNYVAWALGFHAEFIRGFAAFVDYRDTTKLRSLDFSEVTVGLRYEQKM